MGKGPLALLILVMSMFGPLSTDMYLSGLPQMVDDFGTNEATMNMSLYMFMLVLSFSILFLGPISDKYGRRNVLAATMSVYIVSNLACMFVTDVWVFIILRMIQAFGGAGAMVSGFALIKDCFKGPERGRILSIVAVLGILGPILSPVIGTALINTMGWHSTFLAPALIALLCLAMGMLLPKELPVERLTGSITQTVRRIAVVLKDRGFTMFLVMMTIFVASQLAYISVSSYIYQDKFGFSTTEYSIALAAVCIISLGVSQAILRMHLCNLKNVAAVLVLGAISTVMMALLAEHSWVLFMASMIPCCASTIICRSFGFEILMNHHHGDNGSVSSVLNFGAFIFAFCGMVIASSFPSDLFIYGIAAVLALSCLVYLVMWIRLKQAGYPVRNLTEGLD